MNGPPEPRPGLLVSVRSAEEARAAVLGGASIVDIKEPAHGPLGRASVQTWREVREAVPPSIPVSVALGELNEWDGLSTEEGRDYAGIAYRKLGLAGSGPNWHSRWSAIRDHESAGETRWIAVAYADWTLARSPHPSEVLEAALGTTDCSGVLVDTWDKSRPSPLEVSGFWENWAKKIQQSGRLVVLAGGLDRAYLIRLAPLRPDYFAVRGAACDRSDRLGTVRREHVADLVRAIRSS